MALLFWDSFDHYATGDILEKWSFDSVGLFSSYAIGAYGRNGTNGIRISKGANRSVIIRKSLGVTPDTVIMGMSVEYVDTLPSVFSSIWEWLDGTTVQLQLRLNNDGSLEVLRNGVTSLATSAGAVFTYPDVAYYIEMKALIDNAAGTVEVRINDDVVIDEVALDTQQTANAQVTQIQIGGPTSGSTTNVQYSDDLYVCDDSGAECNDFLGDTRVVALFPDADGAHTDWTPSAGVDHYAMVDENPPDGDTTTNNSATPTDRDSFDFEDLPGGIAGTVHAVCAAINSRKDDAGTRTLQPSVRVGGTDYDGSSVNIPDTYAYHNLYAWELNPDIAAAWTVATVNALESGYELVA